jgi:hypothetical protein
MTCQWRYILFASLLASESALILSPSPSAVVAPSQMFPFQAVSPSYNTPLHSLFSQRVAYQHVRTLHQLFVFLSIALSQVAPQLFPNDAVDGQDVLERLRNMVGIADREGRLPCCLVPFTCIHDIPQASIMLHTELHSIPHPLPISA